MIWIRHVSRALGAAFRRRRLLYFLVYQQVEQRYNRSLMGFLWTLLSPALTFATFVIVFSFINQWDFRNFQLYFLSGYVFWNFFSTGILMAADSVVGNPVYITRVRIPAIFLPLSSIGVSFIDLGAGILILAICLLWNGMPIYALIASLPVSVLCSVAFASGLGLITATCTVFFRDFRHLLNSIMFLWFFFSPILWQSERVSGPAALLVEWNPVTPFLRLLQEPAWRGDFPGEHAIMQAAVFSAIALAGGLLVFTSTERKFYYHL